MRIAINGFGRIGRTILRQVLTDPHADDITITRINDIAPPETCAYLLNYDSVYGPLPQRAEARDGALHVAGRVIPLTQIADPGALNLGTTDLLMECTGRIKTREDALRTLDAGATRVLVSGPCEGADVTCVLGANEAEMGAARIVSNASCTTNALAPLLRELDSRFGILTGHMTTIHCYTGSQPMVDAPRGDTLVRSRAGAVSMVPTTTSAMKLIDRVLPHLAGRVTGAAVRVPTISVSAVDLTVRLKAPPADMAQALREMANDSAVIGLTEDPTVSTDLRGRPESLVLAPHETRVTGDQARIFGWYDNEWGFSARMRDMARRMTG